jgi:hypothetical protein
MISLVPFVVEHTRDVHGVNCLEKGCVSFGNKVLGYRCALHALETDFLSGEVREALAIEGVLGTNSRGLTVRAAFNPSVFIVSDKLPPVDIQFGRVLDMERKSAAPQDQCRFILLELRPLHDGLHAVRAVDNQNLLWLLNIAPDYNRVRYAAVDVADQNQIDYVLSMCRNGINDAWIEGNELWTKAIRQTGLAQLSLSPSRKRKLEQSYSEAIGYGMICYWNERGEPRRMNPKRHMRRLREHRRRTEAREAVHQQTSCTIQ